MKRERDTEDSKNVEDVEVPLQHSCPFLDTVDRSCLDFDFSKRCSVTLSPLHCYACLVCGRYFQGRGVSTPAFTHALEAGHRVFMSLRGGGRVFCLPDGYEVKDRSLDDVRFVLDPRYTTEEVLRLEEPGAKWARSLDGGDFLPGIVGLNNLHATDYAATVLQALMRVRPLRDALLLQRPAGGSVVNHVSELVRKAFNPHAFRGHVSPHELMQIISNVSGRRFRTDVQADPVEFLAWLLHTLHRYAPHYTSFLA